MTITLHWTVYCNHTHEIAKRGCYYGGGRPMNIWEKWTLLLVTGRIGEFVRLKKKKPSGYTMG